MGRFRVLRHRPRVLVLDLHQPGVEQIVEEICRFAPGTRVLLLADPVPEGAVRRGLNAGASGVLGKPDDPAVLLGAVRVIARGDTVLCPRSVRPALRWNRDRAPFDRLSILTTRERDVLRLVAEGHGNAAIGRLLFVSESAVKTHVSNILAKLRCENRVQAALIAYRAGAAGDEDVAAHGIRRGGIPTGTTRMADIPADRFADPRRPAIDNRSRRLV
jgi:DNA-binding NarL/FixJ family response regulator